MLRHALRRLRYAPMVSATVVALLAVGIGGNLIVFSLLDAVLFRARPGVRDPETLVQVWRTTRGQQSSWDATSYPDYVAYRDRNQVFAQLAGQDLNSFHFFAGGAVERLEGSLVTPNYFETIGVAPAAGRFLAEREEAVAVISHRLWERRFDARAEAIGAKVDINGIPHIVVGVAAKGFHGFALGATDLWVPMAMAPRFYNSPDLLSVRTSAFFLMVARLKPGVTLPQAKANVLAIANALEREFPIDNKNKEAAVTAYTPIGEPVLLGDEGALLTVTPAIFLVALFAVCANIAGLLVARAVARQRESAIRLALGISRSRLVAQSLAEGLILSMAGALGAVAVWLWARDWVHAMIPHAATMPASFWFTLDWRMVAAACALAIASACGFAILPGVQAARVAVLPALRLGEASGAGGRSRWLSGLTIAQVAVSVVLLASAGLLTRSVSKLRAVESRLDTNHLLVASLDPERSGHRRETSPRVLADIVEAVRRTPGVRSAAIAKKRVFDPSSVNMGRLVYGGTFEQTGLEVSTNIVSPGYFETAGIRLRQGRDFADTDSARSPIVAIVNETLARKFWPGEDPIGKTFRPAAVAKELRPRVVGVVADAPYRSVFDAGVPLYYLPFAQLGWGEASLHVRTQGPPMAAAEAVRKAVASIDARIPLHAVKTMTAVREESFYVPRLAAELIGSMAGFTFAMAVAGLFATLTFQASRRRREIGVRMALGASSARVLKAVLADGMKLVAVGVALGAGLALAATRLLSALLYDVSPNDPATFVSVAAVFGLAGLVASAIPAQRAASANPVEALRHD